MSWHWTFMTKHVTLRQMLTNRFDEVFLRKMLDLHDVDLEHLRKIVKDIVTRAIDPIEDKHINQLVEEVVQRAHLIQVEK